jgi:hypothetical protein
MSLRCFIQTQAPIPGSTAQPVRYPACEWLDDDGSVHPLHPLNRFVCSWLTSDITSVERCQEVLDAMAQIDAGQLSQWFADGNAFCVDFSAGGVQFNQSNVGPEDKTYWNQLAGRLTLPDLKALLSTWRDFLAAPPSL